MQPTPQHFCFLLVDAFSHLAFSCAVEPLRIANLIADRTLYSCSFRSRDGGPAMASNETQTLVHGRFGDPIRCARLFVLSGQNVERQISPEILTVLRRERVRGTKIGALCSGAWILAQAGLLDGLQAAIHWDYHDGFSEAFPDVHLNRGVFVLDETFITASGGTATADLMLALIAQDQGRDLAIAVADQMVYSGVRSAGAEQTVSLQSRVGARNPHLAQAVRAMEAALERPRSPTDIARDLGISVRQLERIFGQHLNTSPKRYYMALRLARARQLLIQTEASVIEVSLACGFESASHFS
ncbi:MAG: GlxA family transcriptional regulator, partial [Pseudomonadota bacterium]